MPRNGGAHRTSLGKIGVRCPRVAPCPQKPGRENCSLGLSVAASQAGRFQPQTSILSRLEAGVQDPGPAGRVSCGLCPWRAGGRLLSGSSRGRPSVRVCVLKSSFLWTPVLLDSCTPQ